jgi:hypothetical protein
LKLALGFFRFIGDFTMNLQRFTKSLAVYLALRALMLRSCQRRLLRLDATVTWLLKLHGTGRQLAF